MNYCTGTRWFLFVISLSTLLYSQQNDDLRRQLTAQQKLLEKQRLNIDKCLAMTKKLLIEKVSHFTILDK